MSGWWMKHRNRLGGGAALQPYEQILALAEADGWTAVYDPTNPNTRTLASTAISAVADGLGNLPNLVQGTAANRPTLSVGAFGVLDGMLGDGTDGLAADITDIPQPFTILCVCQRTSGTTHIVRTSFGGNGLVVAAGPVWRSSFGSNLVGPEEDTNQHVIASIVNGASSSFRLDGVEAATGDAGTNAIARLDWMGEAGISAWVGLAGPMLIRADADAAALGRMETLLGSFF